MFLTQNLSERIRLNPEAATGLHEQIRLDLAKTFPVDLTTEEDNLGADLTIREGNRLAVIEVKTGDPDLPLPSSTLAQMGLLTERARKSVNLGVSEILPVLVTNYNVSEADKNELDEAGIKLVCLESAGHYDPKVLSQQFAAIVGLETNHLEE